MVLLEIIILLNNIPLFSLLKTEDIYMVASIASEEVYGKDDVLFYQGDLGDKLYIVVSGEVQVIKQINGVETQVATIKENEVLGELSLFDAETRTATVRGNSYCHFLVIERNQMEQLVYEYPAIAFGFIKVLISRMRNQN
jgi:CRP/FNR family transcriptional regulator